MKQVKYKCSKEFNCFYCNFVYSYQSLLTYKNENRGIYGRNKQKKI